jgi:hypothetical protein
MFKNTLQVEREREDAEGTHAFRNIVYIKLCSKTLCKWLVKVWNKFPTCPTHGCISFI